MSSSASKNLCDIHSRGGFVLYPSPGRASFAQHVGTPFGTQATRIYSHVSLLKTLSKLTSARASCVKTALNIEMKSSELRHFVGLMLSKQNSSIHCSIVYGDLKTEALIQCELRKNSTFGKFTLYIAKKNS